MNLLARLSDELAAEIGRRLWEGCRDAQLRGEPVSQEAIAIAAQLADTTTPAAAREWLSLDDAAAYADVSSRTIYNWRRDGLAASRRGGRTLINRHDLDTWIRQGTANIGNGRKTVAAEDPIGEMMNP